MGFGDRLAQADLLITVLDEHLWSSHPLADHITIVPYGYETHVPDNIRQQMRSLYTTTAKFVRFTPDFFVIDQRQPDQMYLLEYKTTQTPLYSRNRISEIGHAAGIPDLKWQDIGQMEAAAYDNYVAIRTLDVRVVILNYCAYHERALLCDYIENLQILHRDIVRAQTTPGSRTPFVNFNCNSMRSLDTFIRDEHGMEIDQDAYAAALQVLTAELPVQHHRNSPYNPRNQRR